MKSNNTQYKTRQRQFLCCDFSYICMWTQRSNNICFNWTCCSSQTLTEQSRCRERAACALISRRCGDHTDTLRDSLKFIQEVARFVTSRFFFLKSLWGSKKALNLATKLLSWQHCASLLLTSLSVWLQQHAFSHVQEYLDHGQSEGGPPFTISDWFRPRYEPNVCLLLNHRETFRVAETFSFLAPVRPQIFFSRTIEKLGCTLEPCTILCYTYFNINKGHFSFRKAYYVITVIIQWIGSLVNMN